MVKNLAANQIAEVATPLCESLSLNCELVTGGHTKRGIREAVFKEVDLVIGSFGGFSKYVSNHIYKTDKLNYVVLDEADTLLDDSFNEKLSFFLKKIDVSQCLLTNQLLNYFINVD